MVRLAASDAASQPLRDMANPLLNTPNVSGEPGKWSTQKSITNFNCKCQLQVRYKYDTPLTHKSAVGTKGRDAARSVAYQDLPARGHHHTRGQRQLTWRAALATKGAQKGAVRAESLHAVVALVCDKHLPRWGYL
jgi:hypothetical protein